jgi:hypothetical protein
LFREYPDIKQAYQLSTDLTNIFNQKIDKRVALTKLARWFNEAEASGFKAFATIRRTFEQHYATIVNYFEDRETNAYAESFNFKMKDFRRNFRGVRDIRVFLFRLNNIFGFFFTAKALRRKDLREARTTFAIALPDNLAGTSFSAKQEARKFSGLRETLCKLQTQ